MNLRQLRNLVALAEELNFRRAAERCNISQPPFSRSIAMLEAELGANLFDRDRRSVKLTEAGRGLLHDARRILALTEDAAERAHRIGRRLRGSLTLGFADSSIYSHWPQILREFREAVPDVRIEFRSMSTVEQIRALREGVIDIGAVRMPIREDSITTEFMYRKPLIVALPVGHLLLETPQPVVLATLAPSDFVTYELRRSQTYSAELTALCRHAGFKPNIAHLAGSTEAMLGIVACGQAVAIVPHSARRLGVPGVDFRPLDAGSAPLELASIAFGLAWLNKRSSPLKAEFITRAQAAARRIFAEEGGAPAPARIRRRDQRTKSDGGRPMATSAHAVAALGEAAATAFAGSCAPAAACL